MINGVNYSSGDPTLILIAITLPNDPYYFSCLYRYKKYFSSGIWGVPLSKHF
jgi:hypothetical protein